MLKANITIFLHLLRIVTTKIPLTNFPSGKFDFVEWLHSGKSNASES